MLQRDFAEKVAFIVKDDNTVLGLAAAGSWLTKELDEFSDLDLIIVTMERVSSREQMIKYAERFGDLLSAFTGEHVGEPRLLICLYDNPLLHVDIKFVTLQEFEKRIEDPVLLVDKQGTLAQMIAESKGVFPYPDYQWIEDRFWTWVHYVLLKIGRGEYFEALDFFGFIRMVVLGPLLHIRNGNLPRGVRKVETLLPEEDQKLLRSTVPSLERASLLEALQNVISLYLSLRQQLYGPGVKQGTSAEEKVLKYYAYIRDLPS